MKSEWRKARPARYRNFPAAVFGTSNLCGLSDVDRPLEARPSSNEPMHPLWQTIGLLMLSNLFMTFAWYGHLRHLGDRPWYVAVLVSWSIALFEYMLQVPANRIGFTVL